MNKNALTKLSTSGIAPIFIILITAVIAIGGTLALVSRDTLKEEFKSGDIPNQEDFQNTIDSNVVSPSPSVNQGNNENWDFGGAKSVEPTPAAEPPFDSTQDEPVKTPRPVQATAPAPPPAPVKGCVNNAAPVFTTHITDLSKVNYIAPPPTLGGGNDLKTHSYIGTDHARVPVYAPVDMDLSMGSFYEAGPYMLDFEASCEVRVRFGHMTEPVEAIKKLFPDQPAPGSDSRTHSLPRIHFKTGELVGFTTGTSMAGNWDFGVYNSTVQNRYAQDLNYNWSTTYTNAVCPFDYFAPDLKKEYQARYNPQALGGNPPHGESFCK